ncbi:hypothetical protein PR202_ga15038 [Eleusine coracana subsp. coracana]|uniref:Uncharacterized protein n=1 Tax=Eleusine coracana subsp. coracana TaxID=191504 RepID=A0AAV5CI27_ELECO|nr:hypothetical protein PR202_ga15038 [Eleusine coracana subsp. coracana]
MPESQSEQPSLEGAIGTTDAGKTEAREVTGHNSASGKGDRYCRWRPLTLSRKTKTEDDRATLGNILSKHILKPKVYIGCMKFGPVLSDKDVRYYEPEHWKFGDAEVSEIEPDAVTVRFRRHPWLHSTTEQSGGLCHRRLAFPHILFLTWHGRTAPAHCVARVGAGACICCPLTLSPGQGPSPANGDHEPVPWGESSPPTRLQRSHRVFPTLPCTRRRRSSSRNGQIMALVSASSAASGSTTAYRSRRRMNARCRATGSLYGMTEVAMVVGTGASSGGIEAALRRGETREAEEALVER